jgi:hypothetical protein
MRRKEKNIDDVNEAESGSGPMGRDTAKSRIEKGRERSPFG